MDIDLATLLAVMGVVLVGNPLSLNPRFSIDGYTPKVNNILGNLGGLLGTPRGLRGSHNIISADSSNTRGDPYTHEDDVNLRIDLFEELYNMTDHEYNMTIMAERASVRLNHSIATNPYMYHGPVTGMIVCNSGFIFVGRLLANHSGNAFDPTPHLSTYITVPVKSLNTNMRPARNVLKSFYSVEGEPGNFTYTRGHERIPENWYRIPTGFGLVDLNLDVLAFGLQYPELIR